MKKEILLGDDAIVAGALDAGVNFVSGYPGCPSAEIGQGFQGKDIHFEWSSNEKTALEAAIGASFSGLKSLVNMKSFGLNVCSDSLFPLAYTGTKAPMVIVVADDPSCWSSAQSEQDSRGYAYISHIPVIEPADVQECYDFTRFAFEMSEKFNTPVILRITTRVAHQRAIVLFEGKDCEKKMGEFTKNPYQFCTMPPRILEMKKELLAKLEKIRAFGDKANRATKGSGKIGIIATGVSYFHTLEALKEMNLNMPVLKIGTFYPLNEKRILSFAKNLKKILVVEELDDYLEREVKKLVKAEGTGIKVGELNSEKIGLVIAKLLGKTYKIAHLKENVARRYPKLCSGCPHLFSLDAIRKAVPEGTIFAGDIGCYMIAGYPPHNMQDFLFSMSAGLGISHGISKSTNQKVVALIGDGTFFHSGISALINIVYNKSNPLIVLLDNRITAMTGHQENPGKILLPEEIASSCGVKHIKVLDPVNKKELEDSVKEFLQKEEVSLIVCRRICALLAKRQNG